ncbi:hypothetical protein ACTMU2_13740 [Cupriavidus basilensis]
MPWAGRHWGNAWISFQKLPKKNSLEIVRGSHLEYPVRRLQL